MRELLSIIVTVDNYIACLDINGEILNEYFLLRRVLVDNIPQSWYNDMYKLGGDNMNCKESPEIISALEYCKGKTNKQKQ